MPAIRVLDCRIFFNDVGNAQNAFDHLVALSQHAADHDIQVGADPQKSWVRLHDCLADEQGGDTSDCATVALEVIGGTDPVDPGDGDYPAWQEWDGTNENLYQLTWQEGDTRVDESMWGQPTRVTHNDLNWEATTPDNHWEPGEFGWQQI